MEIVTVETAKERGKGTANAAENGIARETEKGMPRRTKTGRGTAGLPFLHNLNLNFPSLNPYFLCQPRCLPNLKPQSKRKPCRRRNTSLSRKLSNGHEKSRKLNRNQRHSPSPSAQPKRRQKARNRKEPPATTDRRRTRSLNYKRRQRPRTLRSRHVARLPPLPRYPPACRTSP